MKKPRKRAKGRGRQFRPGAPHVVRAALDDSPGEAVMGRSNVTETLKTSLNHFALRSADHISRAQSPLQKALNETLAPSTVVRTDSTFWL